jgi:nitrite reductase/ring-hydroxylating ferredoxin subunit
VGHPRARGFFRISVRPLRRTNPVDAVESLERTRALDAPARSLSVALRRFLRPGKVKDMLHGVPFGHPAHPALTDIPLGCWMSAAVLDMVPGGERASRKLVAAGLVSAVPTALTGLADWSSLHREQQRVGLVHAMATATAATLYTASLIARARGRVTGGKALGFAGLGAVMAGGYLGGHLAFRQAAGANHAESVAHLIPLGWHDLCPLDELPEGEPAHRRLGYISLFVLRDGDGVQALADGCSHLAGPLHQGRLVDRDGDTCVVCPWHGSTFRVADGAVVHGPATARQPAFETRVNGDGVVQVRPVG